MICIPDSLPYFVRRSPAILILFAIFAAALTLSGCGHAPPPKPAPRVMLDYRNGWYHRASGTETIAQIATRYQRDPVFLAEISRAAGPFAIPPADKMLYIPPCNDRAKVRELLIRLQGHPELIPKTPYVDPKTMNQPALPYRTVIKEAPGGKVKRADTEPIEIRPNNPLAATKKKIEGFRGDPPSPGQRETILAEPKPTKKRGLFGWMFGGKPEQQVAQRESVVRPKPRPPTPAPSTSAYLWPVKGKVVATYRSGWRQACHGIEIAVDEGTPVRAARAGKVMLAEAYPGYGNLVLIDHGDGYATAYGYTREMVVRAGQLVERGQTIASVGRPTRGSSSRLLFQVRRNALPIDPLPFLKDS